MKTNKRQILDAALTVFSQKGYYGARLRDISSLLGITKPALYKHFTGKEELWDATIDSVEQYYAAHTGAVSGVAVPGTWEEFRELSLRQITFTLYDDTIRRVRRLLTVEQFHNSRMSALATKHFITEITDRYTKLFAGMMEAGLLPDADPALLALQYTAPITMLIHLCDREPEQETKVLETIGAHIQSFSRMLQGAAPKSDAGPALPAEKL